MRKLAISYDLNRPGQNYPHLYAAIKQLGDWIHPMESLWFVRSQYTAKQSVEHLRRFVDANDKLFACEVGTWASLNVDSDFLNQ